MANLITDTTNYDNIANAIRAKNGQSTTYLPSEMSDAIKKIGVQLDSRVTFRNSTFTNPDMSWFDTSNRTGGYLDNYSYMFYGCPNLTNIDLSTWELRGPVEFMFFNCPNLTGVNFGTQSGNLSMLDYMFGSCPSLQSVDLSWVTIYGQITGTFISDSSLQSVRVWGMSNPTPTIVEDKLIQIFQGCSSLTSLDLSSWNCSPTSIYQLFDGCTSLMHLDIRNIDFSNVGSSYTYMAFNGIPNNCEIIVKDQAAKDFILGLRPNFTNIVIAS